jgi:Family of unknown function (DUF6159)
MELSIQEEAAMFDKISRSWALAGQCWKVLKDDPALLVFPLMSTAALLLLVGSFAAPVWAVYRHLDPVNSVGSTTHTARLMYYLMMGVFYVINYSVMMFFNTALIAVALRRLDGDDASVGDGLQVAWDNLAAILGYALIAATIGGILRAIEERVGFIGRIVIGLIGAGWTIASSMTLPILVVENVGPIEAITRSLELMKRNWGENIVGNGGISLGVAVIAAPCVLIAIIVMNSAFATRELSHIIPAVILMGIVVCGLGLVSSTLHAIYTAALYRFATGEKHNAGIDDGLLSDAFRPK